MRRISIFGATGSIGQNTIDLIADGDGFAVEVLTGGRNVALLAAQARRVRARLAVTAHVECRAELQDALAGSGIEVAAGTQTLLETHDLP